MDYGKLMELDCGQSNPISQLVQHVTQDQTHQENIGNPPSPGLMQYHSMSPQCFEMNKLMTEIEEADPQRFSIPSHYLPSTTWADDYQHQLQEDANAKFVQWWNEANPQNCDSKTNNFNFQGFPNEFPPPLNNLQEPQHFRGNAHYLNPLQMYPQKEVAGLGKVTQTFKNFKIEDGVMISDLDELEDAIQPEENCTTPQEVQSEPIPEPNKIREFVSPIEFHKFLFEYVEQNSEDASGLIFSKEKFKQIQESLLNLKNYSHIENNPMRYESDLAERGMHALHSSCYSKAILCLDAAAEQQPTNPMGWLALSLALSKNGKYDQAIAAAKRFSDLFPECYLHAHMISTIYLRFECTYQVCQSIFHWLEKNEFYNHLIPPGFTMENKQTTQLKKRELDTVKDIFLKAAQQNPVDPDGQLQVMIGMLYKLSHDFDKVVDCNLTAFNSTQNSSVQLSYELLNAGSLLFSMQKPYEALEIFFKLIQTDSNTSETLASKAYSNIGMVYMYLKNYKEAIKYLKEALDPECWPEEYNSNIETNTLEEEYQLCLDLYLKCNCKSLISNSFDKMKINDH